MKNTRIMFVFFKSKHKQTINKDNKMRFILFLKLNISIRNNRNKHGISKTNENRVYKHT